MKDRIDELANLMGEFKLSEAEMSADGFRICFRKRSAAPPPVPVSPTLGDHEPHHDEVDESYDATPVADSKPAGVPVTSPMTGIYYGAPSPSSPPFIKEGDEVTAGMVVGLIEAMKVFNEVPCPTSGRVQKIVVESGQLVNLGDPLFYIG